MNRKILNLIAGAMLTPAMVFSSGNEKPNIVIFLVDDFGWKDLSCYGSRYFETPAVDKLARKGVRFTNAYSACTVSSPTRAALMTGKYPARLHVTDWIPGDNHPNTKLNLPDWSKFLPVEEQTIAEILKENGYQTASIGKWHLGEDSIYWPEKPNPIYAAMVESMDQSLGKIVKELARLKLISKTYIFFMSDNGADCLLRQRPIIRCVRVRERHTKEAYVRL